MVILLDGSSKLGRAAIAENATELNPAWKHLALEVIEQAYEMSRPDPKDDSRRARDNRATYELHDRAAEYVPNARPGSRAPD